MNMIFVLLTFNSWIDNLHILYTGDENDEEIWRSFPEFAYKICRPESSSFYRPNIDKPCPCIRCVCKLTVRFR